jgi:hypothetical protein
LHLTLHITNYKCNFDAVMKSSSKCLWSKLAQKGSVLLVLLFLCLSTAQLFHTHTEVYSDQHTAYDDKEQIQILNKCSVCDYYHHLQGKQILVFYPTVETIFNPEAITLDTQVLTENYEYTLQVIANKGPPRSH